MELDSDHRIVSILLLCSLRTTKGKPFSRPKLDWRKLQDAVTREQFQIELSNIFEALQCNDTSAPIMEKYKEFEHAVSEVAEKVVGKRRPCGMPNWVTNKTIQLKSEGGAAKRKSRQSRERWRKLNSSLNASYKSDEAIMLSKQMEDLSLADSKGDYTTTWKIIHDLSGKYKKSSVKVNKRESTPPTSDKDLLAK